MNPARALALRIGPLAALIAAVVGCGAPDEPRASAGTAESVTAVVGSSQPTDRRHAKPIEMLTWGARAELTSSGSDPFTSLLQAHATRFPDDVIINGRSELASQARLTLQARMLRNDQPETFEANIGADLMQWVKINGLDARESKVMALEGVLPDVVEWRATFPATILKDLTYDGKMYAVPANVHRINTIFYNKHVLSNHGLTAPRSVDDFAKMAKRLEGTGISLFALGSREPWPLALFVFECLLVSREGAGFYSDYFRGQLAPDDPRMIRTLEVALTLLEMVNPDYAQLTWAQAQTLVVHGRAAMTVIGDWARTPFQDKAFEEDFGEIAFPGSEDVYVYTSDTFALPVGAKNLEGAKRLLSTIGSYAGQRAFNAAKGSLSPRSDVPPPDDLVLRAKSEVLKHGPLVLALSGLVPARFMADLGKSMAQMMEQKDIEPVVQTLRSRYALLR